MSVVAQIEGLNNATVRNKAMTLKGETLICYNVTASLFAFAKAEEILKEAGVTYWFEEGKLRFNVWS